MFEKDKNNYILERAIEDMAYAREKLKDMEELYFNEKSENERLRLEIDKIEKIYKNSLSWKITSPLRKMKKAIEKIIR